MDPISVRKGDNLTKIAKQYDTTVDELIKLNPQLKDRPNTIFVGEKINLPKPPSEKPYPGLGVERQDDGIPKAPWQQNEVEAQKENVDKKQVTDNTNGNSKTTAAFFMGGAAGITGYALGEKYAPQIADATRNVIKKAKVKMDDAKAAIDKAKQSGKKKMNSHKKSTKNAFKLSRNSKNEINLYKGIFKTQTKKLLKDIKHIPHDKRLTRTYIKGRVLPQAKTTFGIYRSVLQRSGQIVKEIKGIKFLGRAAAPLAATFECYNIGKAYKQGGTKKAVKQAGVSGASLGGAWAGAKAGAAIGVFGGPVGAVVGGVVGGVMGYAAGNWLGRKVIG